MPHLDYLILNESTLFYFNFSASKTCQTGIIQNWMAQVAKANKNSNYKVSAPGTATSSTVICTDCTTASSSVVVLKAVLKAAAMVLTTKKRKAISSPKQLVRFLHF